MDTRQRWFQLSDLLAHATRQLRKTFLKRWLDRRGKTWGESSSDASDFLKNEGQSHFQYIDVTTLLVVNFLLSLFSMLFQKVRQCITFLENRSRWHLFLVEQLIGISLYFVQSSFRAIIGN